MDQASFFCPQCQCQRLFTRQGTNHILYLLLTLFLCGLFLPIWVLIAISEGGNPYFCSQCGYSDSVNSLRVPRQCERCQKTTGRKLKYCHHCGFVFLSEWEKKRDAAIAAGVPLTPQANSMNWLMQNRLPIAVGMSGLIFLGLLFLLIPGSNTGQATPTPNAPQFAPSYKPSETPVASKKPKTQEPLKTPESAKRPIQFASVISENANLRKSPDINSEVIATLPQYATIQITQQKGAWFLASVDGKQGWIHGNAIRLE